MPSRHYLSQPAAALHGPARQSTAQHSPVSGFGLVEVMVSITLGLLLTAAVLQVFVANNRTYKTADATSEVDDSARYLQEQLTRQLRMAGYRGCYSKQATTLTNTLNSATTLAFNFATGLRGYDNLGSPLPTDIASLLTGDPAPLAGQDLLLVQNPDSVPLNITANSDADKLYATSAAGSTLASGDIAMVTDCNKAHVFQITKLTTSGTTTQLEHDGSSTVTPGNHTTSWDTDSKNNIYNPGAEVFRYQTLVYYLATNPATGRPALYRKINTAAAAVMLDDVYALQITYGVDTNGDRWTDSYVTASNVTGWDKVLAVRMQLVLGSSDNNVVDTHQQFAFNDGTFTASDNRWYLATIVTAVLRNRLN